MAVLSGALAFFFFFSFFPQFQHPRGQDQNNRAEKSLKSLKESVSEMSGSQSALSGRVPAELERAITSSTSGSKTVSKLKSVILVEQRTLKTSRG